MHLGLSLGLTQPSVVNGVADPVTDPTFNVGIRTLAGAGGQGSGDETAGSFSAVPDSATIDGGTNSSHWQIVDGYKIAPSATGVAASLSGSPYSLTVTYTKDSVGFEHTVTITTTADAYSVATPTEFDAALDNAAGTNYRYIPCGGHAIKVVVTGGQSNSVGFAANDAGATFPAGAADYVSATWPTGNALASLEGDYVIQAYDDTQTATNIGFQVQFAIDYMAANTTHSLVFVGGGHGGQPCTVFGPNMDQHTEHVSKINAVMSENPDFELLCVLWSQGEEDAANTQPARKFSQFYMNWADTFRTAISAASIPVIFTPMQPTFASGRAAYEAIDAAIADFPNRIEYTAAIDSTSLTGPNVHFDAASYRTIGTRMVSAISTATANTFSNAPSVVELAPVDGATGFNPASPLAIEFNRFVVAGTGNIVLRNTTDGTDTTISITDGQITFKDNIVLIRPTGGLTASKSYAVKTIDSGAIVDEYGNSYAGWTDNLTNWNFVVGAAATLTPALYCTTLHHWWDSDAGVTLSVNDVTQWTDQTNSVNMAASGGTNPTQTTGGIVFDGTGSNLLSGALQTITARGQIFMGFKRPTTSPDRSIIIFTDSGATTPYLQAQSGFDFVAAVQCNSTYISVHEQGAGIDTDITNETSYFETLLGGASGGDYVVELDMEQTDLAKFATIHLSGHTTRMDLEVYDVVICEGCDTLAKEVGMISLLDGELA